MIGAAKLGLPNLQGVYDASPAVGLNKIVLSSAKGAVRVADAATPIATELLDVVDNSITTHFFRVFGTGTVEPEGAHARVRPRFIVTGSGGNRIIDARANQIDLGELSAIAGTTPAISITDSANIVEIFPSSPTFTAAPGAMFAFTGTMIHNYANVSISGLSLSGTMEHQQAGFLFNHFLLFNNGFNKIFISFTMSKLSFRSATLMCAFYEVLSSFTTNVINFSIGGFYVFFC